MSFDLDVAARAIPALAYGLLVTVGLVAASLLVGGAIGAVACYGRLTGRGALCRMAQGYVGVFRSLPEPVLIFWVYYCGPLVLEVTLSAFGSGVLALSLGAGAYLAEIFRAGILAVPRGQVEAARALGLSTFRLGLRVVGPQAWRIMLPALFSYLTTLTKNSALVSAIGAGELFYQANIIASDSFRYFELFTMVGVMYLALIVPLSLLSKGAEGVAARATR